jgi:predicted DNA-binding protein
MSKPVRVSQELLDRLEQIGAKSGKSVREMIQRAVEEYISFNE